MARLLDFDDGTTFEVSQTMERLLASDAWNSRSGTTFEISQTMERLLSSDAWDSDAGGTTFEVSRTMERLLSSDVLNSHSSDEMNTDVYDDDSVASNGSPAIPRTVVGWQDPPVETAPLEVPSAFPIPEEERTHEARCHTTREKVAAGIFVTLSLSTAAAAALFWFTSS